MKVVLGTLYLTATSILDRIKGEEDLQSAACDLKMLYQNANISSIRTQDAKLVNLDKGIWEAIRRIDKAIKDAKPNNPQSKPSETKIQSKRSETKENAKAPKSTDVKKEEAENGKRGGCSYCEAFGWAGGIAGCLICSWVGVWCCQRRGRG